MEEDLDNLFEDLENAAEEKGYDDEPHSDPEVSDASDDSDGDQALAAAEDAEEAVQENVDLS